MWWYRCRVSTACSNRLRAQPSAPPSNHFTYRTDLRAHQAVPPAHACKPGSLCRRPVRGNECYVLCVNATLLCRRCGLWVGGGAAQCVSTNRFATPPLAAAQRTAPPGRRFRPGYKTVAPLPHLGTVCGASGPSNYLKTAAAQPCCHGRQSVCPPHSVIVTVLLNLMQRDARTQTHPSSTQITHFSRFFSATHPSRGPLSARTA